MCVFCRDRQMPVNCRAMQRQQPFILQSTSTWVCCLIGSSLACTIWTWYLRAGNVICVRFSLCWLSCRVVIGSLPCAAVSQPLRMLCCSKAASTAASLSDSSNNLFDSRYNQRMYKMNNSDIWKCKCFFHPMGPLGWCLQSCRIILFGGSIILDQHLLQISGSDLVESQEPKFSCGLKLFLDSQQSLSTLSSKQIL